MQTGIIPTQINLADTNLMGVDLADVKKRNSSEKLPNGKPYNCRRYLAVSLPRLATDRIIRKRKGMKWRQHRLLNDENDTPPLIVIGQIKNAWRITHLDEMAEQTGLCHGQSLSDARAICPHIEVVYDDIQSDQLLLEAIADWCDRYTPLVSLDAPDGIILDITGCAHLFGGEKTLANELLRRLFQQGFSASGAVAANPGAAWAASRFSTPFVIPVPDCGQIGEGQTQNQATLTDDKPATELNSMAGIVPVCLIEHGKEEEALAILPLAGLRLDSQTLGGLAKLGLRTIGQVMIRPRAPLTRRFGKLLMLRLDQALGHVEEAISSRLPVPELMAERKLAEPIGRVQDIEILIERLSGCLCEDLERRGAGARNIDLALFRIDGKVVRLGVGTSSPLRDPKSICRLFYERLAAIHENFDAGLGFEVGRLSVLQIEPFLVDQTSLLTAQNDCTDFTHLVDKLGARLGLSRILCLRPGQTHLPEKVDISVPVIDAYSNNYETNENIQQGFFHLARPMRLLVNPEPVEAIASVPEGPPVRFRWRRKLHVVVHVEGPERISDEWWGAGNQACNSSNLSTSEHTDMLRHTRDYFRIEDEQGYRYWLYRQGLYASETNSPRWYMHGIFA